MSRAIDLNVYYVDVLYYKNMTEKSIIDSTPKDIMGEITFYKNSMRALVSQRFFKTDKGEYGEGDIFYGLTVPQCRIIVKKYAHLPLASIKKLLYSKIHESRLIALLILVAQFQKGDEKIKKVIFDFYILHHLQVNNWDLVDSSADKIVGEYLRDKNKGLLIKLSKSKNLWERRIAMISCFAWIKRGEVVDALAMAERLVGDGHDIIQKAVGWMLREIGKRELSPLVAFLDAHAATMPRTMLRYAIEKFSDKQRKYYLYLKKIK